MTKVIRVGDSYDGGSLPHDGASIPFRVSVNRRDGSSGIPEPYRAMTRYDALTRTPIAVCHALARAGDSPIAPLTLAEAKGSCIAMIDQDADPTAFEALRNTRRVTDDLVAVVHIEHGHLPRPAEGQFLAPSPLVFESVDREGRPVVVYVEEIASVRIEWDRKSERAVVAVGRGRTIPVEAFGFGLYSDDLGETRVPLEEFIKARRPSYRRTPGVHQALTRTMLPLRRTERDRETLAEYIEVRETGIVAGKVTEVEISMSLGDEARMRLYGTRPGHSRRSRRSIEATRPLPFDEVKVSRTLTKKEIKAIRDATEGEAERSDSKVNALLRKMASEVFMRMDTLTLRTYCAIVCECRGDAMEWVEDAASIIRLLGIEARGKSAAEVRTRIDELKRTPLTLTVKSADRIDTREMPLFAPSGTVSSKDRATGRELMPEGRPRPVWNLSPSLVAWMNTDGGHFSYLDPQALRLGDLATEWEFRVYLVLCDRWASGLVKRRQDPERAEEISAGALLDAAGIDWRVRFGYAADGAGAPSRRRPKEFAERFETMAANLVDSGFVQFAEVSKVADDPVNSKWRFVAPMDLRHELEAHSSKRLAAAGRGDRRKEKRLKGRSSPDGAASG
jgi:hypothetical protein